MKKESIKNKKVTIDDLAVMIADGREETNELARMVAKGFESIDKRFESIDKRFEGIDKRLENVEENLSATRRDVLAMGDRFTLKYEFHDLSTRVSLLEQKVKTKR
ncbi:MAG: hypothetical protein ACYCZ7_00055 [Minisyncoccota bacterium]